MEVEIDESSALHICK